jgi:pyruvate kinase
VESVKMMDRIIREAEAQQPPAPGHSPADCTQDAVAGAAVSLALDLDVACIVAFTRSGSTALRLARRRPSVPILALSPDEAITRRLSLVWGVISHTMGRTDRLAALVDRTERTLRDMKLARSGDRVVLVMGYPPGRMGRTDLVKLHEVGEGR